MGTVSNRVAQSFLCPYLSWSVFSAFVSVPLEAIPEKLLLRRVGIPALNGVYVVWSGKEVTDRPVYNCTPLSNVSHFMWWHLDSFGAYSVQANSSRAMLLSISKEPARAPMMTLKGPGRHFNQHSVLWQCRQCTTVPIPHPREDISEGIGGV